MNKGTQTDRSAMPRTRLETEVLDLARQRRAPYLAALGAPKDKRPGLLAVLAFDAELAGVCERVSEPMLGRIRLQWWLDALPGVTGGRPPGHPVAQALAELDLGLAPLRAMVETYNFDLDDGPAGVDAHLAHADAKGAVLAGLLLDVLGVEDDQVRDAAAEVVAAWTLSEVVRHAKRLAGEADARSIEDAARERLERARSRTLAKPAAQAAMPVLALARLVDRRLNVLHDPMGAGAVLSVWWAKLTGKF